MAREGLVLCRRHGRWVWIVAENGIPEAARKWTGGAPRLDVLFARRSERFDAVEMRCESGGGRHREMCMCSCFVAEVRGFLLEAGRATYTLRLLIAPACGRWISRRQE